MSLEAFNLIFKCVFQKYYCIQQYGYQIYLIVLMKIIIYDIQYVIYCSEYLFY
jgi:hypothetical protein